MTNETKAYSGAAEAAHYDVLRLFGRAEALKDYPGQMYPALHKAEKALEDWAAKYPAAAAELAIADKIRRMTKQAEKLDRLAANPGNADGWNDAAAVAARVEEMKAQAAEIRRQIAELKN